MPMGEKVHSDVIESANMIESLLEIVDPERWLGEGPEPRSQWDAISNLPNSDRATAVSGFRALGLVDQMRGLVGVMRSGSLYSGFTMARSVLEGASYGMWIWDDNITPEESVCRYLLEMKNDAIEEREFWRRLKGKPTSIATPTEIDSNFDEQDREVGKFDQFLSDLRQQTSQQLPTERPTSANMFAEVNEKLTGLVNHKLLYSLTSGIVHQSTTALVHLLTENKAHQMLSMRVIDYMGPIHVAVVFFDEAMISLAESYGKSYPESDMLPIKQFLDNVKNKHINLETFVDMPEN